MKTSRKMERKFLLHNADDSRTSEKTLPQPNRKGAIKTEAARVIGNNTIANGNKTGLCSTNRADSVRLWRTGLNARYRQFGVSLRSGRRFLPIGASGTRRSVSCSSHHAFEFVSWSYESKSLRRIACYETKLSLTPTKGPSRRLVRGLGPFIFKALLETTSNFGEVQD